jgi:hypothetical protein
MEGENIQTGGGTEADAFDESEGVLNPGLEDLGSDEGSDDE